MKTVLSTFLLFFFASATYAQGLMNFKQLSDFLNESPKNIDVSLSKLGYIFHKSIKQPYGVVTYYNYKDSTNNKKHSGFDVTVKDGRITSVGYDTEFVDEFNNIMQSATNDRTYKSKDMYLSHHDQPDQYIGDEYNNGVYEVDYLKWKEPYGIDYSISISLYVELKLITTPVENTKQ